MNCGICGKELTDEWRTDSGWRGDGTIDDNETPLCNTDCRSNAKEALQ